MKWLFPKVFRLAFFYKNSLKISVNNNLSLEKRIQSIEKREKRYGGRKNFTEKIKKHSVFTFAITIGKKDMGQIFLSLNALPQALEYLQSAEKDYEVLHNTTESLFRKIHLWILLAKTYAAMSKFDPCFEIYDTAISHALQQVEKDPSDARFHELYGYSIQETYKTYLKLKESFPSSDVQSKIEYLLNKYSKLDLGNEQIEEYLQEIKE